MSIYSGFATRQQEETYDDCVDSVVYILVKRIIKFYEGERADEEKFINMLCKLNNQMRMMEGHKYLEPKSSHTFDELVVYLKKKQLREASVNGAKMSEADSIHPSQFQAKNGHIKVPISNTILTIPKSDKKSENRTPDAKKVPHLRPETTNKIRKHNGSDGSKSGSFYATKRQANDDIAKQTAIISRNQPRVDYHNISNPVIKNRKSKAHSFRMNNIGPRQAYENMEGPNSIAGEGSENDNQVRELIRGYISRTKKNYLRGYSRRKEEIDNMFKENF